MQDVSDNKTRRNLILLVVILGGLVGSVAYQWYVYRRDNVEPLSRQISDFVVTWHCQACGHEMEDNAGPGPKPCPTCGQKEMYASLSWFCPSHGAKRVLFQYADGNPTQIRVEGKGWVPAYTERGWNIHCPTCGAVMAPAGGGRPVAATRP